MSKTGITRYHTEPGLPATEGRTDWAQGRTRPDAPALALLAVIDREPEIVRRALH